MARVVVIGGGVIGLCSAYSLSELGFEVTVLDDNPGRDGCSYGNGGIVVPSHFMPLAAPGMVRSGLKMLFDRSSPFGIADIFDLDTLQWATRFARYANRAHVERAAPLLRDLNLASRAGYEKIIGDLGIEAGFAKRGLLMICQTVEGLAEERHTAEQARRLGLPVDEVDRFGLRELEPSVEFDAVGGFHFRDDAHVSPSAFMHGLQAFLTARGVTIRSGVRATSFAREGSTVRAVRTADGDITGDHFVLAAGAWTGSLAGQLGLKVPLRSGKGYGFTLKPGVITPELPAILTERRVAITPMADGVRVVGTLELGAPNFKVSQARVEGIFRAIHSGYPATRDVRLDGLPLWVGNRPCTPDGLPIIGKVAGFPNVTLATGHAMMGMSLGPISGELVASLIAGTKPSIDLQLLSPARFN